jgi:2-polyprenyl-3-methyl-5-hydroxy-6-metoxy-1,4-benzoquinol methylase
MYLVNQQRINQYLGNDVVEGWLDEHSSVSDEELVCHRWLRQTPTKRLIFSELYGNLLISAQPLRVLDVGGGLTGLTRELATRHHYVLADLLAHDDAKTAREMAEEVGADFIRAQDWATLKTATYDLIIANDIFPNVDQRLEIFLQRFLPCTRRMRLSLTYYEVPRYYMTRRIDADEILCMLAWNSEHLSSVLKKYSAQIVGADFEVFALPGESVFSNGRQVCIVELKGGLEAGGAL